MGGNYEKSMYSQLMEVMARLDAVEQKSRTARRWQEDFAKTVDMKCTVQS